uniref:Non-virion protein n=1 Tax=Infectious hematopoietic necrosis virus TaxID=11290 RepID=A0A088CPR3_9RHAB|nr:non-virion protein [Infectious hematopoietic necrosis virus]QAA77549.1 non-virion protein [Infectious hematopoietic necrosis virus]
MDRREINTYMEALREALRYKNEVAGHGFLFDDGDLVWREEDDATWSRLCDVVNALISSKRMQRVLYMDLSITKDEGHLLFVDLQGTKNRLYKEPRFRRHLILIEEFLAYPR